MGKVSKIEAISGGKGITLTIGCSLSHVTVGESIAVEGICLTVIAKKQKGKKTDFTVDVGEETLRKSTAGNFRAGCAVNLERSLKASTKLGGHFVQGHVDAAGTIIKIVPEGNSKLFYFSYPKVLEPYMIPKGSISVDGISLTLAEINNNSFAVSIIPFTEKNTSLGSKKEGDHVNLEADILAKVVARQVELFLRKDKNKPPDELYQKKTLSWEDMEIL